MQRPEDPTLVVSVIICTRNRASLLADVLQTLCEQDFDRSRYEVVVVDNGSTDETRRITEDLIRRNSNVRYCCEATCGLSHARNRGWQEANGQYVAYIDDDCKAPPQWLTAASEIIDEHAPAVFGGPYYAFYQSSKPNWWDDQYGAFELSSESHMLEPEEFLRGGNLFIRRSLLSKLKGFDVRLGMSGQRLGYGEETELQDRVREMAPNERLYYDSNMYVHHLVRREKMTWRWILRSWFASGRSSCDSSGDGAEPSGGASRPVLLFQSIKMIIRGLSGVLNGAIWRDRDRYPSLQNHIYENSLGHVQALGMLYERFLRVGA